MSAEVEKPNGGSDGTGVLSSSDGCGEASPVDESGSGITGVFSRNRNKHGGQSREVQHRVGWLGNKCSGQEQIVAGCGVMCHLSHVSRDRQSISEAGLLWREGRLHVACEQRGAVQSGISQGRVQIQKLTSTGDGVNCHLSHKSPEKRSISEAGLLWREGRLQVDCEQKLCKKSRSCKQQVQLTCNSGNKADDVSDGNQCNPRVKPQEGTKCKVAKENKHDHEGKGKGGGKSKAKSSLKK